MASTSKNTEREAFDAQILELAIELERHEQKQAMPESAKPVLAQSAPAPPVAKDDTVEEPARLWEKLQQMLSSSQDSVDALAAVVPVQERLMDEIVEQLKRKNALESANEKLFNALHEELRGYKDAFLFEALQKPIARDLIGLMDDLERVKSQLDGLATADNFENLVHHLREILHRMEVHEMDDAVLDSRTHKILSVETASSPEADNQILRVVRRGYRWRDRVLRPQEVVIARWTSESSSLSS